MQCSNTRDVWAALFKWETGLAPQLLDLTSQQTVINKQSHVLLTEQNGTEMQQPTSISSEGTIMKYLQEEWV